MRSENSKSCQSLLISLCDPLRDATAPLCDENGKRSAVLATIEDIRERKRINVELGEKSAVLAAVNPALTTFLESGDWGAAPLVRSNLPGRHSGQIDVLLTDVVMPELRGPELARQVKEIHPETCVVYMSGYAESGLDEEIPPEAAFLQKPFRFATLMEQLKLLPRKA